MKRSKFLPLVYGWWLSVEGRAVVVLEFHRGLDHAKGSVDSWLVVPIDQAGGGELDVGGGLVGAVVE